MTAAVDPPKSRGYGVIGARTWLIIVALVLVEVLNLAREDAPVEQSSEVTGLMMALRGICTAIGVQLIATFLSVSQVRLPAGKSYPSEDANV